jgi:DMSO/TMAO reductase YedYZ molybdopterin-dependent catalytic subunit
VDIDDAFFRGTDIVLDAPRKSANPLHAGGIMKLSIAVEATSLARRRFLASAGALGFIRARELFAHPGADLPDSLVRNFPQKGPMILQRTRPPLLETPFEVFDRQVFTPNDRFYVRWHLPVIPTTIDPAEFRLNVHGRVGRPLSLTLDDLVRDFSPFEIAAVNQCSGNSRRFFQPRVPGAQWKNGAMGNALWRGVRLQDVLDRAGVAPDAAEVRFRGLDTGVVPQTPNFMKSLAVDHARDGEVMIAYEMNGQPLPLLNGFPIRLVVPGWYATYWVKMLADIEVLSTSDDNYWMRKAYLIPDTPEANITPEQKDVRMVPINRMVPRSFFTHPVEGAVVHPGEPLAVRGIAFGGDAGVAQVLVSTDGGQQWQPARLGKDHGRYSFRLWELPVRFAAAGMQTLRVKAESSSGSVQPEHPNWNGGGYLRNVSESVSVRVA